MTTLIRNQKKTFSEEIDYHGTEADIIVEVRHDDECGNGHNSFAITGSIYKRGKRSDSAFITGGCIHDEIAEYFPELAPLIKWHLCSTDGPMHYVANSLYHARTTDHEGKQPGEPVAFKTRLQFQGCPFTFSEQSAGFWDYLESVVDFNGIEVEIIPYDGKDSYSFEPNYSLTGFIKENESKQWYKAPFKTKREADEFLAALRNHAFGYQEIPTAWCKAVEPNLEYARNSAIWPDAELSDFTREKLEARLPGLLADFRNAVESIGFAY